MSCSHCNSTGFNWFKGEVCTCQLKEIQMEKLAMCDKCKSYNLHVVKVLKEHGDSIDAMLMCSDCGTTEIYQNVHIILE